MVAPMNIKGGHMVNRFRYFGKARNLWRLLAAGAKAEIKFKGGD